MGAFDEGSSTQSGLTSIMFLIFQMRLAVKPVAKSEGAMLNVSNALRYDTGNWSYTAVHNGHRRPGPNR
jgi:hypothetical protein